MLEKIKTCEPCGPLSSASCAALCPSQSWSWQCKVFLLKQRQGTLLEITIFLSNMRTHILNRYNKNKHNNHALCKWTFEKRISWKMLSQKDAFNVKHDRKTLTSAPGLGHKQAGHAPAFSVQGFDWSHCSVGFDGWGKNTNHTDSYSQLVSLYFAPFTQNWIFTLLSLLWLTLHYSCLLCWDGLWSSQVIGRNLWSVLVFDFQLGDLAHNVLARRCIIEGHGHLHRWNDTLANF